MADRQYTDKYTRCNHHHELTDEQSIIDLGSGEFVCDNERIPLLKALNECGLVTYNHCYGHGTGYSFVGILLDEHAEFSLRAATEGTRVLLLQWKRTD